MHFISLNLEQISNLIVIQETMQREGCHLQLDHQTVHISLNEKITLGYLRDSR
jgi:hypothetical protein